MCACWLAFGRNLNQWCHMAQRPPHSPVKAAHGAGGSLKVGADDTHSRASEDLPVAEQLKRRVVRLRASAPAIAGVGQWLAQHVTQSDGLVPVVVEVRRGEWSSGGWCLQLESGGEGGATRRGVCV